MATLADKRHAMSITLLKALVPLVPACVLFSGSLVLFFRAKTVSCLMQLLGAVWWCWSFLLMSPRHCTSFLGCTGGSSIVWVTTSIFGARFLVSRCFPQDICLVRLQSDIPDNHAPRPHAPTPSGLDYGFFGWNRFSRDAQGA